MLNKANSFLLRSRMTRMYHSINVSGAKATTNETAVLVYNSEEFNTFNSIADSVKGEVDKWDKAILSSSAKSKFFSLVPFHIESVSTIYFINNLCHHSEMVQQKLRSKNGIIPKFKISSLTHLKTVRH